MNIHSDFIHEYDVNSLVSVTPRGEDFSMLVTPRYRGHYHEVEYEAFTTRYLKAVLPHAGIFVDVGAHYGFFSLLAASASKSLRIISVEPVTETRDVLKRNLESFVGEEGDPRFVVCDKAISEESGTRPFNISLSSDNCSFYPHPNAAPLRRVSVETTSLDALLSECEPAPLVVKIDTDGHELAVLRGMRETLDRFENVTLVVEINPKMLALAGARPEQLLAQIETLGFAAFIVDETRGLSFRISQSGDWRRFVARGGYANLICVRKARALSICFFGHGAGATGAERTLAALVKDLVARHGVLCTVLLPQPGPLEAAIREAGAGCVVAPYAWWCYLPHEGDDGAAVLDDALTGSLASAVRDLAPLVADIDPDVICTQTVVIPWGAAVASTLGKPHIWSVCEYGELDHGLRFVPSFREVAADIERCSDFVFFATKDIKSSLFPTLSDERWDVLYRHIEMKLPEQFASTTPSLPRPLQLAIFGTVAASKGQADAIAAVALMKSRGLAVELTIVGRGHPDYFAELHRRVGDLDLTDEVHFVDFLMDPLPQMSRADVALVCSRREAFGRVAVEAMLLGKPVIYAAAGGIAEYMRDGETGLGYSPGNTAALADRIETLLRDNDLRARLGAAGQAFARATFTRDGFSGKFYRKALELRGTPARAHFPASLLPVLQRRLVADAAAVASREREKAGLQEALSGAEHRLSDLSVALDHRAARLAEAQQRIAALVATIEQKAAQLAASEAAAVEAERHRAIISISLNERTAQMREAQDRIAALQATARQAEQRVSDAGARRDKVVAELAQAQDRNAALGASLAERERELALANQRVARIKASLSYRLTAPFRELSRPVRHLQASHLGKKLRAAWRYPFNSHKRKLYRAGQMEQPFVLGPSETRRGAPLSVKLRVFARHPFSATQRKLDRASDQSWRKHTPEPGGIAQVVESPSPQSTTQPRIELPVPERGTGGFRAKILEELKPFDETIASWQYRRSVLQKLSRNSLLALLGDSPNTVGVISFSQDNYRDAVGGIQLCLQVEESAYKRRHSTYIHLSPYQPLPSLAPDVPASDYKFALTLNGDFLGHIVAADLGEVLAAQTARGVTHELVVHSLLGHSPELVAELSRAAGTSEGIYWVHDYFSLCPSYTLMRNSVSHCGAPPPSSPACQICHVGSHRPNHLRRMRDLFSQVEFTLAAPSTTALDVWQASADFPVRAAIVHEHCSLTKERAAVREPTADEPLRVAFLGFPAIHKGWPVFCDVIRLCSGDQSYNFYHLGRVRSDSSPGQVRFVRADATTKDWQAVSKAVSQNRIDVAFLCSLWPETYNFTTLEALAGGALIVTLEGSGNIAALVRKHGCGLVFPSEAALKEAFATGALLTEIRTMQRKGASRYIYTFSDMTAGIRLGRDSNQ